MNSLTTKNSTGEPGYRRPPRAPLPLAAMALLLIVLPQRSYGCASCGCTLSADAAMGYSAMPGWRLSLEYDYIDQNQLRSGTQAVPGVPPGNELEHETVNQYVTARASCRPTISASSWA